MYFKKICLLCFLNYVFIFHTCCTKKTLYSSSPIFEKLSMSTKIFLWEISSRQGLSRPLVIQTRINNIDKMKIVEWSYKYVISIRIVSCANGRCGGIPQTNNFGICMIRVQRKAGFWNLSNESLRWRILPRNSPWGTMVTENFLLTRFDQFSRKILNIFP